MAVAGRKLYRIAANTDGEQVSIDLARIHPGAEDRVALEAKIEVAAEHVAVLAVPDWMLARRSPATAAGNLFVALWSRNPEGSTITDLERRVVENPDQAAVLIEGADPRYPEAAMDYDAHGTVELQLLVGSRVLWRE